MVLLYRPHSQDRPSPSSFILCHSTEKNKWVFLSLSILLPSCTDISVASLSISMICFSLSGGVWAGERGEVSVGGLFCGLLGPQREGNEWGEMIFTTTKKKGSFTARFP